VSSHVVLNKRHVTVKFTFKAWHELPKLVLNPAACTLHSLSVHNERFMVYFLSDEWVCQQVNCAFGVMFWVTAQLYTQSHSCSVKPIWKTTPYYTHTTDIHLSHINTSQPAKHSPAPLTYSREIIANTHKITVNARCRDYSEHTAQITLLQAFQ